MMMMARGTIRRWWVGILLLGLTFSVALPAPPACAKTFYGDFYLGLRLGNLPGLQAASIPTQAMKLPFAGKLYYQDGIFRFDLDLPSTLVEQTTTTTAGEASFPSLKGAGFHVYTVLIPLKPGEITLIDHSARQAYAFIPPPEWVSDRQAPADRNPFEALKEPETIRQLAGQGVRIMSTGRIKGKQFDGLTTNAYELKMKVEVPPEALKDLPAGFKPAFTLHIYFEKETGFPLEFSFLSDLLDFTFTLANLKTDRLPDALFRVPQFYREKTYTESELRELLLEFASRLGAQFSEELGKVSWSSEQPEAPPPEQAGAERTPSTGEGGKRFVRPPPGRFR